MATADDPTSEVAAAVPASETTKVAEEAKENKEPIIVLAVYKFADLADQYKGMRQELLDKMHEYGVRGSLLLASEGINGTISGTRETMDKLMGYIRSFPPLADIEYKESIHEEHPFLRSKVRLKKEIVTMGVDGVSPVDMAGTYVDPKEWNSIISDPNTVLVDTRNDYEVAIGTFKNAVNPNTKTFREFPEYAEKNLISKLKEEGKNIAMFCTGGIRCEKSTSLFVNQGFDRSKVFHLKGGILKYLEEVDKKESMWEGECFVFDERISVNHDLQRGKYDVCHGCRHPITEEDKKRPEYEYGITCHHCIHEAANEKHLNRLRERKLQMELAKKRGTGPHQRDGYVPSAKKPNQTDSKLSSTPSEHVAAQVEPAKTTSQTKA